MAPTRCCGAGVRIAGGGTQRKGHSLQNGHSGGAGNGGGRGKNCWRCWDEAELGKCCSQVDGDGKRNEEVAKSLIRSGNDRSDPIPAPNGGRWVSQTDKSQLLQVVNTVISQNPK